jgi:hypothetical protein
VADGYSNRHVEESAKHRDPPEPSKDDSGAGNGRAEEHERQPQQQAEVALQPPLGPAWGLGVSEPDAPIGSRRIRPGVHVLLEIPSTPCGTAISLRWRRSCRGAPSQQRTVSPDLKAIKDEEAAEGDEHPRELSEVRGDPGIRCRRTWRR